MTGGGGKGISHAVVCTRVRMSVKEGGGYGRGKRDGDDRDTRREKLRELFPCRARHPFPSSVFLSLFFLPTFSVVLLQSVRDAHIFTSP